MFIDRAKIYIKAGDGGDGCTSFYTEKYVPNGGPDGGDGGNGGSVVFVADGSIASLSEYRFGKHYRAESGGAGSGKNRHGKQISCCECRAALWCVTSRLKTSWRTCSTTATKPLSS